MAIMQMVVVACLGWKKSLGTSARSLQNESPETVLSRRGLIKRKGKMVILRMLTHGESDTNRTVLMKRKSGLWNHLIWSYG